MPNAERLEYSPLSSSHTPVFAGIWPAVAAVRGPVAGRVPQRNASEGTRSGLLRLEWANAMPYPLDGRRQFEPIGSMKAYPVEGWSGGKW